MLLITDLKVKVVLVRGAIAKIPARMCAMGCAYGRTCVGLPLFMLSDLSVDVDYSLSYLAAVFPR